MVGFFCATVAFFLYRYVTWRFCREREGEREGEREWWYGWMDVAIGIPVIMRLWWLCECECGCGCGYVDRKGQRSDQIPFIVWQLVNC